MKEEKKCQHFGKIIQQKFKFTKMRLIKILLKILINIVLSTNEYYQYYINFKTSFISPEMFTSLKL